MAKIPASPVIRTIYAVSMFARYLFRQSHLIVIKAPYRRTYSLSLVIAAKTPVPSRRTDLTPCSTCFRGTNQRRSGQRILGERCAVEIQASAVQEQLGLKLEGQKIPFEIFVIDHAEQPSEVDR